MELKRTEEKDLLVRIKDKSLVTPKFKEVLQTICYDVGIRDALDLNDLDTIFNFITRHYGLLNLNQLKEAFNLFSADLLKFSDPKFGHYGNFDLTFIGKVLKAYSVFKHEEQTKPKEFKAEEKKEWQMLEKKKHFVWLRDEVFLDSSKRNGKKGTFQKIVVASFKDIYDYMISERMLVSLSGLKLEERIDQAKREERLQSKNPIGSMINNSRTSTEIPPCFYKLEIYGWFYGNKEKLY